MNEINQRLAQLSPQKRAQLEAYLLKKSSNSTKSLTIPVRSQRTPCSLSFAQQRLWFLTQLQPDSPSYNIAIAVQIAGNLNIAALQNALNAIVARHEILRTTIETVDGEPIQVIADSRILELAIVDVASESDLDQYLKQAAQRPFDLTQDLMLRATLFQVQNAEPVLLLVIHHIASDGWSNEVLMRELGTYYAAFLTGVPASLPLLAIQYADFALWQRQWLTGDVLKTQLTYWQQHLQGSLPVLEMPTDRPRPSIQTFSGASKNFALSPTLTSTLQQLSQQEGVTLYMLLLAVFQILLYRYTQQEDILVGSPIANRKWLETEGLIGFFANTLVLRTNLSGHPTIRELLQRVREVTLASYDNQDIPFEKLVEVLQLDRSLSYNPLVQVMFALQTSSQSTFTIADLTLTPIPVSTETAKFDLILSVEKKDQLLISEWSYNTDLFDHATIERMNEHYQNLLTNIDLDQPISTLQILTKTEQDLFKPNLRSPEKATDLKLVGCIHQQFEIQVEKTPDAIAVQASPGVAVQLVGAQSLTYRQLNQKANQLAYHLRNLGVQPDQLVGVFLERSPNLIIGLLAILKAGGAYLPLDLAYPSDRLQFMLNDAQVSIMLTDQTASLPLSDSVQQVNFTTDWDVISQSSVTNPVHINTGCDLAYVLYTSGSTGRPKGVLIPHQAVLRLVLNTNYINLQPFDTIAQVSNSSFDAATFEIWGALLNGAQLTIISKDELLSPQTFAKQLQLQSISVLFLTTALLNQFSQIVPEAFQSLRYLLFGGEAADPRWVKQILDRGAPQHLLHVYGPTENTTFSTWCPIFQVAQDAVTLPIGRAIANTDLFVLDRALQPVPIGVPGELYLGGTGLARSYLKRPDLTDECFISIAEISPNLYKTGDLVRYLPDGNLEFLGRIDRQVKIRGFRIELGEIEIALKQNPDVQDALVLLHEDADQGKSLIAYIVSTQILSTDALRLLLQQTLPDYLIPSAFIVLNSLPLTPNGKVDRQALSSLKVETCASTPPKSLPSDPFETQLLHIWQSVLGIQLIRMTDNFFELGGHSLLAVRLIAQIERIWGQNVPLAIVFQAPTIAQMACLLQKKTSISAVPIEMTPAQVGKKNLFWCAQGLGEVTALAKYLGVEQPFFFLDNDLFTISNPAHHVRDRAVQGIQQLKAIQPNGPYWLGGFCLGSLVAFEMALQLQAQGEDIALLALVEPPKLWKILSYWDHPVLRSLIYHKRNLAKLTLPEQPAYLIGQVKRLLRQHYSSSKEANPEEVKVQQAITQGLQAVQSYIPRSTYSGSAILCFSQSEIASSNLLSSSSWDSLIAGNPKIRFVVGDHFSFVQESGVQRLANWLSIELA